MSAPISSVGYPLTASKLEAAQSIVEGLPDHIAHWALPRFGEVRAKLNAIKITLSSGEAPADSGGHFFQLLDQAYTTARDIAGSQPIEQQALFCALAGLERVVFEGSTALYNKYGLLLPVPVEEDIVVGRDELQAIVSQFQSAFSKGVTTCLISCAAEARSWAELVQNHLGQAGIAATLQSGQPSDLSSTVTDAAQAIDKATVVLMVGTAGYPAHLASQSPITNKLLDRLGKGAYRLLLQGSLANSFDSVSSTRQLPWCDCRTPTQYFEQLRQIFEVILTQVTGALPLEGESASPLGRANQLATFYRKMNSFQRATGDTATFEEAFVPLTFVACKGDRGYEGRAITFSEIYHPDRQQTIRELFADCTSMRLFLAGRPGGGKSTLLRWVVHTFYSLSPVERVEQLGQWTTHVDQVIRIELRDVIDPQILPALSDPSLSVEEKLVRIVESSLPGHPIIPGLKDVLFHERTCLLLDGIDDVQELVDDRGVVGGMLQRLLGHSCIVVTGRTYMSTMAMRRVEVVGLPDGQIEEYAQRFFVKAGEPKKVDSFVAFLKKRRGRETMPFVPLTAEVLCHQWLASEEEEIGYTQTSLYKEVYVDLSRVNPDADPSLDDLRDDPAAQLRGFLAFETMVAGRGPIFGRNLIDRAKRYANQVLELSPEQLEPALQTALKGAPMIKVTGRAHRRLRDGRYYFQHGVLQEFSAALHLQCLLVQDPARAQAIIQDQAINPRWEMAFAFLCGLMAHEGQDYDQVISQILDRPNASWTGFTETVVAARCLDETDPEEVRTTTRALELLEGLFEPKFFAARSVMITQALLSVSLMTKRSDRLERCRSKIKSLTTDKDQRVVISALTLAHKLGIPHNNPILFGVFTIASLFDRTLAIAEIAVHNLQLDGIRKTEIDSEDDEDDEDAEVFLRCFIERLSLSSWGSFSTEERVVGVECFMRAWSCCDNRQLISGDIAAIVYVETLPTMMETLSSLVKALVGEGSKRPPHLEGSPQFAPFGAVITNMNALAPLLLASSSSAGSGAIDQFMGSDQKKITPPALKLDFARALTSLLPDSSQPSQLAYTLMHGEKNEVEQVLANIVYGDLGLECQLLGLEFMAFNQDIRSSWLEWAEGLMVSTDQPLVLRVYAMRLLLLGARVDASYQSVIESVLASGDERMRVFTFDALASQDEPLFDLHPTQVNWMQQGSEIEKGIALTSLSFCPPSEPLLKFVAGFLVEKPTFALSAIAANILEIWHQQDSYQVNQALLQALENRFSQRQAWLPHDFLCQEARAAIGLSKSSYWLESALENPSPVMAIVIGSRLASRDLVWSQENKIFWQEEDEECSAGPFSQEFVSEVKRYTRVYAGVE